MRVILILFVLLTFTDSVLAQKQSADSVYALPTIRITALRIPTTNLYAPVHISSLDAAAIEATFSSNLAELLDRAGSPFVRQYGTGLATLSFRGTSSSQTLILLDGIPLSDPQLGQIDLSLLPTSIIEEAHLLHGHGSALYGSQSIGGVINLKTQRNIKPFFLDIKGFAGPYEERSSHIATGLNRGPISGFLSLSHRYEQGDFPYLNPSLFPPRTSRRIGADRRQTSLFGKVMLNRPRASTTLSGWFNDTERGLPGAATTTPKDERQWDKNSRLQVLHFTHTTWGLLSLTGALQKNTLRYLNPQLDLDQTSHTSVTTLEAELSEIKLPFSMTTGITGSLYKARHPGLSAGAQESRFSWFVNGSTKKSSLKNIRAIAFPALRIDTFFPTSGNHLVAISPSLGFNVQPLAFSPLRLKASLGRAFRAPTFNDRFWQPGGNPDLKPEHSWNYEAGVVYSREQPSVTYSLETTRFYHRIKNQITWLPSEAPGDQNIWRPQNLGVTQSAGAEASAAASFNIFSKNHFTTQLTYTFVDSRDVSNKNQPSYNQPLRYVPRHVLKTRLGLTRRTGLMRWHLDFSARHISRRYITTDGSQYLKPYTTADIHLRITKTAQYAAFTAGVFFENITNEAYEVVKGYPVPPRLVRIQLSVQLTSEE